MLHRDYASGSSSAWGHNNIARGRAGISRRTSLCGCSGASDRVEQCACIVQEHSLERTEVGYPEFVEQALQHTMLSCASVPSAIHVSTCPKGTDVTEGLSSRRKVRLTPPVSWGTLPCGWGPLSSSIRALFARFYGIAGWRGVAAHRGRGSASTNQVGAGRSVFRLLKTAVNGRDVVNMS